MPHTLGAPQPAAYVFGPWTLATDRPDFAYRSAPREDDRAEVWLHVPDDGKDPYWAGCFGGSDCFDLRGPSTMEEAQRVMDQRLVLDGHLLAECVDRDRRALEDARRWEDVARVAREIDAKHRGDGIMADDDTVDLIALTLKDFPGLVQERDRIKAVLDAETGRKGLPGWKWYGVHGGGQWVLHVEGANAFLSTPSRAGNGHSQPTGYIFNGRYTEPFYCTDALQGMERAEDLLRSLGKLPPKG